MKNNKIKILFLAKYAPESINSPLPCGIEDSVYAQYHHDIYKAICDEFENVSSSNNVEDIIHYRPDVDYIFSLYNRMPFRNSEVFVSSLAEYYNIAYLGARPNIRSIAEDKHLAKVQALHIGLQTPKWFIYNIGDIITEPPFDGPYFIKPRFGASSLNIDSTCYCSNTKTLKEKILLFHSQNIDVIVEQYIKGTSITVPILNNFGNTKVLPYIIETSDNKYGVITYAQKRKIVSGLTRNVNHDLKMQIKVNSLAKIFFDSVQPLDYTRMDFIIDSYGNPFFIEFNVCCNLGKHAAINIAAKSINISYNELISNILYSSLYRQNLINCTCGKEL